MIAREYLPELPLSNILPEARIQISQRFQNLYLGSTLKSENGHGRILALVRWRTLGMLVQ